MRRLVILALLTALSACAEDGRTARQRSAAASGDASAGIAVAASADPVEAVLDRGRQRTALGDNDGAEKAFREAVALIEAARGDAASELPGALLQLGLTVSLQRRVGEAESLFARAERLARTSGDGLLLPRLATYRAIHLATGGDLETALVQAQSANLGRRDLLQAETARRAPGSAYLPILAELAHGLLVEGSIALRLQRLDAAELAGNLARRILVDLSDTPEWWLAEADELVGLVEAERRQFDEARERLGVAVATRLSVFGERRPVGLGLISLGRLNLRAGDTPQAVADVRRGIDILRADGGTGAALSFSRLNDFLSIADAAAKSRPSEAAVLADDMFRASQMTWRSVTSRTISVTIARLASAGGGATIREWQQAALQRDELRLALGREAAKPPELRDPARLEVLRDAAAAATRRTQELSLRMETEDPRWASLVDTDPVGAAELAAVLQPDEALLSYAVGPDGAWGFLVRRSGVTAVRLDADAGSLGARVGRLRRSLDAGPTGTVPAFETAESLALHRLLVAPFERQLSDVRHLLVAPDGPLQSLPFGILAATAPGGPSAYTQAAWLGQRLSISVVPSVRSLVDFRRFGKPSTARSAFLGIGAPALRGSSAGITALAQHCREDAAVPPALLAGLPALPDSADELQRVRAALRGGSDTLLIGAAATESALRRAMQERHRILYFATHALLPGELRCQSEPGLVLTPGDGLAAESDGLLTASEIARLDLDADLVVLSACNTAGPSGELGGEALSGLTRAFFHAGARRLLVTHWPVESRATTDLMSAAFGGGGQAGTGLADRIRQAQAGLLADPATAHPFFWGAFALIGDGRTGIGAIVAAAP